MFKSILVTSLLALSVGLNGCGKTNEEKAKDAADKGNSNTKVMNSLIQELAQLGVVAYTTSATESLAKGVTTKSLNQMDQATLETTIQKLNKLRAVAIENLNIVAREDVTGGDSRAYQTIANNCLSIKKEIEALLAEKFKQQPATETTEETEEPKPAPKTQAIPGTNVA